MNRRAQVCSDIAQPKQDQFSGRIVGREVTAGLDDLSQLRVDALDGVGRVDHFSNCWRENEEWNHSVPSAPLSSHYRWILLAPWPTFKGIQSLLGRFDAKLTAW